MESDFAYKNFPITWGLTTLGEIVKQSGGSIQTGPFGSQLHASDYVTIGIPSVMPKNITIEGINEDDIARITEDDAKRLSKYLLDEGDIVYSRRGDVEKCALVKAHERGWLCGTGCLRIRLGRQTNLTSNFLHAYLSTPAIREWVSRNAIGATMPNLNTSILSNIPVLVPTENEINFFGDIWYNLNQKITLNRQINQTLEQMAQTLFKSWFVDFDPVIDNALDAGNDIPDTLQERAEQRRLLRAKTDIKPLPAETRALFPSEFEETELGWVPKGWQIRQIKDVVERISVGKKYSQKELKPTGHVPVLDQAKTGVIGYHEDIPGVNASIENPVIIFANHTCVTRLISYDFSTIQNVLPFKFKNIDIFWTYLATQGKQQFEEYKGHWPDFEVQDIIIPNEIASSNFGKIVRPYFEKIVSNEKINEGLIAIRDALLPKLISGELELDALPETPELAEAF